MNYYFDLIKLTHFWIYPCLAFCLSCSNKLEAIRSPHLSPLPDIYWDRERSAGGTQERSEDFFPTLTTPIGKYQIKLYRTIGEKWLEMIKDPSIANTLIVDRVLVQFHVLPDGVLSEVEVLKGEIDSIIYRITAESLEKASKAIGPFEPTLLKQYSNGFVLEIGFRTY